MKPTQKGYKHIVKPPKESDYRKDGLTNHQRHLANRELRRKRYEATMIEKYGSLEAWQAKQREWGAKADHVPGGKAASPFAKDHELASRAGKKSKRKLNK